MANIRKLHEVPLPTADEVTKKDLIATLERTLAEAKRGDVTAILMIIQHANPAEWSERSCRLDNMMTWAGRVGAIGLSIQLKNRESLSHE